MSRAATEPRGADSTRNGRASGRHGDARPGFSNARRSRISSAPGATAPGCTTRAAAASSHWRMRAGSPVPLRRRARSSMERAPPPLSCATAPDGRFAPLGHPSNASAWCSRRMAIPVNCGRGCANRWCRSRASSPPPRRSATTCCPRCCRAGTRFRRPHESSCITGSTVRGGSSSAVAAAGST